MPYKNKTHTKESNKSIVNTSAYLVLAILLFSIISIIDFQKSYAQTFEVSKITGFSEDIIEIDYVEGTNILWVLTGEVDGSFFIGRLVSVNAISESIITTTQVFNETSSINLITDMDCSSEYCYFVSVDPNADQSENGMILRADISANDGTVIAPTSEDILDSSTSQFTTEVNFPSIVINEASGVVGTTVWTGSHSGASTSSPSFFSTDGLFVDWSHEGFEPLEKSIAVPSAVYSVADISHSRLSAPDNFLVGSIIPVTGDTHVFHYDLDQDTLVCVDNIDFADAGAVVADHIDLGVIYIGTASGIIKTVSLDDCQFDSSFPQLLSDDTGLSGTIFDMNIVNIADTKYLVARDVGTGGNISFIPWNGTHFTESEFIINSAPNSAQGNAGTGFVADLNTNIGKISNGFDVDKMFVPMTNTDRAVFVIDFTEFTEDEDEDEGFGVGGQGTAPTFPENTVTDLSGLMLCLGGVIDSSQCDSETGLPTDTDPTTNGTGIMMLLFAIILSYAVLVSIHYGVKEDKASQGVHIVEVMNIHPVLLVMMVVANFTLAWHMGWIDDLIFYTMIVIVIGLAGFGLYRQVKT